MIICNSFDLSGLLIIFIDFTTLFLGLLLDNEVYDCLIGLKKLNQIQSTELI